MTQDILIVDDEKDIRELVSDILEDEGFSTRTASDSLTAFDAIRARVPSAIILDIWLQGSQLDGLGILETLKNQFPQLPVIMISGHGNIETAISSIRLGAYDYLEKPFKEDKLKTLVRRAIESARLRLENEDLKLRTVHENKLVGESTAINQLNAVIERVAGASSRIFITGPAGCGKELAGRLVHQNSLRKERPFVVLNAASLSQQHMEEELFGVESGDISGVVKKVGLFEKAHGGTLFIDEVGDLPMVIQGKLLRLLQENSFERVNGNARVAVDVRIIASTSKDMDAQIQAGKFREDLFYRLNVVPIAVPALKERREDIKSLAYYFMKRYAHILGVTPHRLAEDAIAVLETCEWPGNVRQLKNIIEWLLIMVPNKEGQLITAVQLPREILSGNKEVNGQEEKNYITLPLKEAREQFEKYYLMIQLERFNGNISRAASFIGMQRSALHRKLKQLKIRTGMDVDGD